MNRSQLGTLDRSTLVDRVTSDVHDTTKSTRPNGDLDWCTSVGSYGTSDETLGT